MTFLDWVLVVVWTGITLGGFFKGAIRIVFGLGGAAMGIWLAVVVAPDAAQALTGLVDSEWLTLILAYLLPFVVVLGLCLLAGWGMERSLEALKLGCLNRLLGALLAGAVAAVVLAMLLVTAVRMSPELAVIEQRSVLLTKVRLLLGGPTDRAQDAEAPAASDDPDSDDDGGGSSSGR